MVLHKTTVLHADNILFITRRWSRDEPFVEIITQGIPSKRSKVNKLLMKTLKPLRAPVDCLTLSE